jgi:uncharacterized protein with HEPN domain
MSRDEGYLIDILAEARLALEFASGLNRDTFKADLMRQHAIIRCLEIIGEATRRISLEFREAHPEIAWHGMLGMRNRLIHEYDEINLNIVWDVLNEHIPALIELIEPLVPPEDELDDTSEETD